MPEIKAVTMLTKYKNGKEDKTGIYRSTVRMVNKILKSNNNKPMKPNINAFFKLYFLMITNTIILKKPKPTNAKIPSIKANVESPLLL
jgi:hypothetical protein